MKKKVKFGTASDESPIKDPAPISRKARIPLISFTDVGFEEQTFGSVENVAKQHDAEPDPGTANLTIRLRIPKGTQEGEMDAVEDESALPYISMRATMLANYGRKQDFAPMDNSEATCQIEGCTANLSCSNGYFRRNKVCQEHFKAFKVEVGDCEQRFCQQCNRFHVLAEFDEDKRSCRLTLADHNNRRKRSQPEATSVLSTGTLVYLPGKARQEGKSLGPVGSPPCEDLERTITNEETDSENNLEDDATSAFVYKEKSFFNLALANPVSSQTSYTESSGKAEAEKLFPVHIKKEALLEPVSNASILALPADVKKEALLLEPISNASISASKLWSPKNSGGKRRSVTHAGHANVCQVEGCMLDLSDTKDYFKRRKVCERHFKAFKVKVQNVDQRFCQQCSRFHVLSEFDEGRKSCKKMLMGHNMRRRKGQSEAVCRKASKEAKKNDLAPVPQSLGRSGTPAVNLGFESCGEKTPALTN